MAAATVLENWNYAHAARRGTIARWYPYQLRAGLDGSRLASRSVSATVIDLSQAKSSERDLRNLYRSWTAFMVADDWNELAA